VTTIGYPEPLTLFALDDQDGGVAPAHHDVVWDALAVGLEGRRAAPRRLGMLVDDRDGRSLLDRAAAAGWIRAVPVAARGSDTFALAHGDGFARHLEDLDVPLAHVGLSWNVGHPPEERKAQVMELARLAAWLHETDRKLLVDLGVPAVASDLDQVAGDRARFRQELHPGLVRRAVQELRDLGVEPDLWVVDPTGTDEDAAALAALALEAGRDDVALLVADAADDTAVRRAAAVTGYRGVVVGRSSWADPLAALAAGRATREETVRAIGAAVGRRLEAFRSADAG
jgi:myo-inositol catabolism protein IolC